MSTNVNQTVTVSSLGFNKNLNTYPRRMLWDGGNYEFVDSGLRCMVRQGERIAEILTMSDGKKQYRLRRDSEQGDWTLLSVIC